MSFDRERYLEGQSERLEVLGKLLNPEQGRLGVSSAGAVDFSQAGASPVGALQQFGNGRNFGPQGMQGPSPFDSNRGFDLPGMQPGGQVNSSPVGPASSAAPEKADEPRVKFRDQFKLPTRPF